MAVIDRIEGFLLTSPVDPPRHAGSGVTTQLEHIVLRITDSDGATGYGECDAVPGAMAQLTMLGRELLGSDPLAREAASQRMRRHLVSGFPISTYSIALDDLVARRLGLPIHALYGGAVRTRVRPYAASYGSLEGRLLESWRSEADELDARGFAAMKLRLGVEPVAAECRALERLRANAPELLALMADGNGGFNPTTARTMGRCAQELGLLWLEEPLPQGGYAGYPELAADLDIPLAGGELSDRRSMAFELLSRHAVDILQPDPVICGGIGETIWIAGLARLFGAIAVPHTSGGAIGVAAGLQALACIPDQSRLGQNDLLFLEYPALVNPTQMAIAPDFPVPVDGWIAVPTSPGLGIEIDGEALERLATDAFHIT